MNSFVGQAFTATGKVLGVCAILATASIVGKSVEASEGDFITSVASTPPPAGARQLCRQYSWACSSTASVAMTSQQELQIVKRVNRKINRTTREVTDQSQYRTVERWALPTRRGGDCEDFALLKKRDLIRAGIDPSKLLIATVLDTRRNAHAVLVYRSAAGDLVLDNLTNTIKPWSDTRYLFLRMQDPRQPENWVGVYRRS
jgi:predicted transglutaminase-like cysteine proteinase